MATDILTLLANPETMKALTFSQKMQGGLLVTLLGMGITFLSLIVLQFVIVLLAKLTVKTPKKQKKLEKTVTVKAEPPPANVKKDNDELIAVISAAVAMQMQKSTGEIRIRAIRKVEDLSPPWNRAGILEQMNMRL